jgi:hypothetical protein
MIKKTMILLALVFLLAACLPAQQAPVDVQPAVNTAVAQTMEAIRQTEDSVAQTVAAQQSLASPTAEADEPSPATEEATLEPTSTPFDLPTLVPTNTPAATRQPYKQPDYACNAINRRPFDNTEFNKNADFDIKWTIVNIGTKAWPAGIDVKYYSGPSMAGVNRVEIPVALAPNESYTIVLDATAPDKKGFHVMTWIVDGPMCYPYTAINVK